MLKLEFQEKVNYVVFLVFSILISIGVILLAPKVFLLLFAGILLSIFLLSLSNLLSDYTKLPTNYSLATVIVLITLIVGAAGLIAAPSVAEQFDELIKEIPKSLKSLEDEISHYSWGKDLLEKVNPKNVKPEQMIGNKEQVAKGVGGALAGLFGFFGNFIIIIFIGLYGAVEPNIYKNGFLSLIPKSRKEEISNVLDELFETLKWWLIGQFFGMAVIGFFTTIGLYLLGVPLALLLGLIAALFTFIPNIGPVISVVPALMLTLTKDPQTMIYVLLLYIGVQTTESYILTPLVQRKTIELPPALVIITQVYFGFVLGGLGIALATPLTAVALVLTQKLYIKEDF